jgi:enediyne biosynthesis protein CalE5
VTASRTEMKDRQLRHWDSVAAGWGTWLEWTRHNFQPLTAWLGAAAGWRSGARVLDVACGAGFPAIDAALAVRPAGRVVAGDLSAQMVAVASERARVFGAGEIEFRQLDAERLDLPAETFDAVTTAYGLMFCPDPAAAVREAHRVLRPGGRIALAVWDEPSRCPFLTTMREVAARCLGLPDPPPDEPHLFRLASPDALRSLLGAAGFSEVCVDTLPMTLECASAGEYGRLFADLTLRSRIAALRPDELARFEDEVARAVQPYTLDGRVRAAATSLCAAGRK